MSIADKFSWGDGELQLLTDDENANQFSITKIDDDKQYVFGWGSVSQTADGETVCDWQDDMIEPGDMEESAYNHVLNFRSTGERHEPDKRNKGTLIESCVFTEEKQKAIGIAPGQVPIGWWVGYYIDDPIAWEKIKSGEYQMFSVEGKGKREMIEKGYIAKSFSEVFEKYESSKKKQFTFDDEMSIIADNTVVRLRKGNRFHGKDGKFSSGAGNSAIVIRGNGKGGDAKEPPNYFKISGNSSSFPVNWTPKGFSNANNLNDHATRHGEGVGAKKPKEYEEKAKKFLVNPLSKYEEVFANDKYGVYRYDFKTKIIGAATTTGVIKTFMNLTDDKTHKQADEYWEKQKKNKR